MATEMSLKLIIDPKSRRVLFAEAGEDVADFIFSLLYMPMASIIKLLAKEQMVGSIGSIYKSIESKAEAHLECSKAKSLILSPTFASSSKFLTGSSSTTSACEVTYVGPNRERAVAEAAINTSGFVKGACTIMDDLTVMPVSSVATFALLIDKFNVKDVSLLEERTVKLGMKEGLELLKASLKSKTVLTDVFLGMKAEPQ